ncbi:aminotransferase class I/II-fold pyridoxal phosphate-dependent enzyme [Acidocella sp.]|uniref:aminotransferase class I/II-fold pyridoxal phosphate-dependent enzyme n=1 Tax=Acidocella sp. TaxID=50710 RepID=UPI00260EDF06|nr:aminotransferase class I/II-fold pyridoxal phosphate-dependent enzyme [Acidocella sp.]MDD2794545.1 aminotransferase class I/II-fold pyridoxal phosphate-dependent enzyme [Acidocella sp.]
MSDFDEAWRRCLEGLEQTGRRRRLRDVDRLGDGRVDGGAGPVLDFSSNDYLGLSHHPVLIERACAYARRWGAGAGSSRLVSGNLLPFGAIEAKIARGKGAEAALVFVSGVQANVTLLPALLDARVLGGEPLVYADRLNHASLIQGCAAAGARQIRFRHNDMGHLEELLARDEVLARPRVIITESVFSMDGDCADVAALAALAEKYGAFLYLDEAHATGVMGRDGFGLAHGLRNALVMGTFSKGLGGFGAYAACSGVLREYLVNRCGGVIYATALPPAVLGAMEAALDMIPELGAARERVAEHAARFRAALAAAGLDTGASTTQIVPLILGAEERALDMARALEAEGFLAVAIRPPTVPAGTSRIRFTFSAGHTKAQVAALSEAVVRLAKTL